MVVHDGSKDSFTQLNKWSTIEGIEWFRSFQSDYKNLHSSIELISQFTSGNAFKATRNFTDGCLHLCPSDHCNNL